MDGGSSLVGSTGGEREMEGVIAHCRIVYILSFTRGWMDGSVVMNSLGVM